ncbi:MAG TPA: TolC family protein [Candidatus Limnocylindria bacterium]|jgi:outer membrane protein TolC|nr:TolC family protein [Candidatus Limnocylindria bacterium]
MFEHGTRCGVNLSHSPVKYPPKTRTAPVLAGLALAVLVSGCSAKYWKRSADRESAQLIKEKTPFVPNMDTNFTIEPRLPVALDPLPVAAQPEEFLGPEGATEKDAKVLPLLTALEVAITQSRDYQLQKEQLYLQSLQLALERHQYRPLFAGRASGTFQTQSISADKVEVVVDAVTGQPKTVIQTDALLVDQSLVSANGGVSGSLLLATGARLTTAFTTDFLRFLTGDPMPTATANAMGQITQPLFRGAGYKATMENLTQSERDLLYALRRFAAYRKDFAVRIASDYYAVLQARDTARNAWADLGRSRDNVRREKAFADEGQRPLASLDQFRQAELKSETGWVDAVRGYRELLDRFKITLGLPIDTRLILDDHELIRLRILDPGLKLDEAVRAALTMRLDFSNTRDQAQDAVRRIDVARNGLLPQVDLVASASMGNSRDGNFVLPDPKRYKWNAGLNLDLPLDRKAERNGYRTALIAAEQAKRQLALAEDQLKLQIASDLRALDQARRNFENAELSVTLGERRVEEQTLRMQLGRGVTRDLLDAQADLNSARNARTSTLVGHTIARLNFWRDLGLLYIKDNGSWENLPTTTTPPPS